MVDRGSGGGWANSGNDCDGGDCVLNIRGSSCILCCV